MARISDLTNFDTAESFYKFLNIIENKYEEIDVNDLRRLVELEESLGILARELRDNIVKPTIRELAIENSDKISVSFLNKVLKEYKLKQYNDINKTDIKIEEIFEAIDKMKYPLVQYGMLYSNMVRKIKENRGRKSTSAKTQATKIDDEEHLKKGDGIRRKNIIKVGRGLKYIINRDKLDNNFLEIKYAKNKHTVSMKPMHISPTLKKVIDKMIDENRVDEELYEQLNEQDKNLIQHLTFYIPIKDFKFKDNFQEEFAKIRGIIEAGNENPLVLKKYKQMILYGISIGKISRVQGYQLLLNILI